MTKKRRNEKTTGKKFKNSSKMHRRKQISMGAGKGEGKTRRGEKEEREKQKEEIRKKIGDNLDSYIPQ